MGPGPRVMLPQGQVIDGPGHSGTKVRRPPSSRNRPTPGKVLCTQMSSACSRIARSASAFFVSSETSGMMSNAEIQAGRSTCTR